MRTTQDIINDPEFHRLPAEDRRQILERVDPQFKSLSDSDKGHILDMAVPEVSSSGQPIYNDYGFQEMYPRDRFNTEGDYKEFHQNPVFGATPDTYPYTVGGVRKSTVSEAAHTAGQVGGLMVGGAVAPETGPVGPALGAAAGESIADAADVAMGLQKPTPISQAPAQVGKDLAEGAFMATVDKLTQGIVGGTIKGFAAPFAKQTAERMATVIQDAKTNGIDLTPAEIAGAKSLHFLENLLSKNVVSNKFGNEFKTKQIEQVLKRRSDLLAKGGYDGEVESLGQKVQSMVDDYVRDNVRVTGDNVNGIKNAVLQKLGSDESYYDLGKAAQEIRERGIASTRATMQAHYAEADAYTPDHIKVVPQNFSNALDKVIEEVNLAEKPLRESPIAKLAQNVKDSLNPDPMKVPEIAAAVQDLDAMLPHIKPGTPAYEEIVAQREQIIKQKIKELGLEDQFDPARNFYQLRENMRQIGDMAASETNAANGATTSAGRWYKILDEGLNKDQTNLFQSMKDQGYGGAANAQEVARKSAIDYYNYLKDPVVKDIAQKDPEAIVHSVFGSRDSISKFKDVTSGTSLFDRAKKAATSEIFQSDQNGQITGDMIRQRMAKYGDGRAQVIWKPEELDMMNRAADAIDGTRSMGKEIVDNKILKDIIKSRPEDVATAIVRPNAVGPINLVESQIGSEAKKSVAKGFLPEIFMKGQIEGAFNPKAAERVLDTYGDKTMNALYGESFVKEMRSFLRVAQVANEGMGDSNALLGIRAAIGGGSLVYALNYARKNPGEAAGLILGLTLGRRQLSYLYFNNQLTRKWLTEGLTIPAWSKRAGDLTSKLVASLFTQEFDNGKK